MKKILLILFTFVLCEGYSQEKITINFQKNTPGDNDLIINNILNQNGYQSNINYTNHNKNKEGYTIEYYFNYGATCRFELYFKGKLINRVSKKTLYFGMSTNRIVKLLSKLMHKKMVIKDNIIQPDYFSFGMTSSVSKLDSTTYLITAYGSGISSLKSVESAFLENAKLYAEGFEYYFENEKYFYNDNLNYSHKANKVIGIIIKNNSKTIVKLNKLPSHLKLR